MASIFEQTIVPKLNFSNFALNETQLISCNFGQLVPVYCREVLPNDVFTMSAQAVVNFAPMVAPMYHNVHASIHFFYVPNRIIWDDFETFITGSEDGHVIEENKIPRQAGLTLAELYQLYDNITGGAQGTIFDYLGLPNEIADVPGESIRDLVISDFPLRSYFKIWYDYYRDENLQHSFIGESTKEIEYFDYWRLWRSVSDIFAEVPNESDIYDTDLIHAIPDLLPFYRSFKKDYFTAALQTPQKGEPVTLSLGTSAPVSLAAGTSISLSGTRLNLSDESAGGSLNFVPNPGTVSAEQGSIQIIDSSDDPSVSSIQGTLTSKVSGTADLSQVKALTVEALREAFAVQEILESLSMRGSRFTEFLKGNFGVTPDDYRLQRPQFLGGLVSPVQVQQVLQQSGYSGTDSRDMTGYAAGRAFSAAGGRIFRQRFKEHGWIIGILSVMPQSYYYQGIPRHLLRKDRFDYYMPQTAHLGEQGIENIELYYDPEGTKNEAVFGFIPRWAEYKTSMNGIHGDFRGNLNYYHMARVFSELPTLSDKFISTEEVPTRPFAVWQTENPGINHIIWAECFFKVTASRPMPFHAVPRVL